MFLFNKKLLSIALASTVALVQTVDAGPRSASAVALDSGAEISDLYAFRSWEDPSKVVFILNVLGGQDPAYGPGYYNFDDTVKYRINIDNDMDGKANDVIYEFSFTSEQRPAYGELTFPLSYVGNPQIQSRPELRGIRALDGEGSEGITFRQTYKIVEKKKNRREKIEALFNGEKLIAVPSNVGPVTMPNYEDLAAQGVYVDEETGIKVFAGQRAEAYYADTGALFDGAAPRRIPPVMSPEEEASNSTNPFGVNAYAGRNVHSIVIELPIERIANKKLFGNKLPYIGVYASTGRIEKFRKSKWSHHVINRFKQASRVGNPLVQTFVIDVPNKEAYKKSLPHHDERYAYLYEDPPLARAPTSEIFGVPVPPPPRLDLLSTFLAYPDQLVDGHSCLEYCSDLLRLDLSVSPTLPEYQHRMGALMGNDPAGIPNGRRPGDDVTDFTVRAIGGPALIFAKLGDGVNYANDIPGAGVEDGSGYGVIEGNRLDVLENGLVTEFPYMATPHSGR